MYIPLNWGFRSRCPCTVRPSTGSTNTFMRMCIRVNAHNRTRTQTHDGFHALGEARQKLWKQLEGVRGWFQSFGKGRQTMLKILFFGTDAPQSRGLQVAVHFYFSLKVLGIS